MKLISTIPRDSQDSQIDIHIIKELHNNHRHETISTISRGSQDSQIDIHKAS